MTDEEIDAMPAGRELDILVARLVFGLEVKNRTCRPDPECGGWYEVESLNDDDDPNDYTIGATNLPCYLDDEIWEVVPEYSTDISATWLMVEKLLETHGVSIVAHNKTWYQCNLDIRDKKTRYPSEIAHDGDAFANAETAPLAISRAALKACKVA